MSHETENRSPSRSWSLRRDLRDYRAVARKAAQPVSRCDGETMTFETKDSGKRVTFSTGMQRDTTEAKPRFDLLMPLNLPYKDQMLTRWAELMGRGAAKYSERNWEKASTTDELARFRESALRHFMQWFHGETDEDHAAAIMFNLTGAEYVKYQLHED